MLMRSALAAALLLAAAPALADQRCRAADPTGTPLIVRAKPNGAVREALRNGAIVDRARTVVDAGSQAWSYVVPLDGERPGWISPGLLNCN